MPRITEVFSFPLRAPGDMAGLRAAVDEGRIDPRRVVCVYSKTEGNGQDNDYSREVASLSLARLFEGVGASPLLIASGGCEGVLSPHCIVVQRREVADAPANSSAPALASGTALAVGLARTRRLQPHEIGTLAQAQATSDAVLRALDDAGLDAASVAFVQVKAPLLTDEAIAQAQGGPATLAALRPHASKGPTRVACALGVGLALGDVDEAQLQGDEGVQLAGRHPSLRVRRTMVTPGNTDLCADVVVYGQARGWVGPHRVACTEMQDLIDLASPHALLRDARLHPAPQLPPHESERIDAVLFKGDPPLQEAIRGRRHVIWRDSDIQPPRHVRAAVGGLLSGLLGTTRIFCAGGAEHQAPDGGGVLALFYRDAPHA